NASSQLEQDIVRAVNSLWGKGQQVFVTMAEWKLTQNT
ncbi:MAG: hypothetical protein QG641_2474, partial [Candidatus Poribacteria bacterium]|nr:hypothetical protein [Candidatus Poribacteria bacterium]MDQ1329185.1 hypothetical protein [Candidatus Poribacteria bacterium]